jgi:hypothetical protein
LHVRQSISRLRGPSPLWEGLGGPRPCACRPVLPLRTPLARFGPEAPRGSGWPDLANGRPPGAPDEASDLGGAGPEPGFPDDSRTSIPRGQATSLLDPCGSCTASRSISDELGPLLPIGGAFLASSARAAAARAWPLPSDSPSRIKLLNGRSRARTPPRAGPVQPPALADQPARGSTLRRRKSCRKRA